MDLGEIYIMFDYFWSQHRNVLALLYMAIGICTIWQHYLCVLYMDVESVYSIWYH